MNVSLHQPLTLSSDGTFPADGSRVTAAGNQQTALARLLYAVRQPGGLAVLCGPGGTGVTTVLGHLAADLEQAERPVLRLSGYDLGGTDLRRRAESIAGPAAMPPVMLMDDGHAVAEGQLTTFVHQAFAVVPAAAIVLAGRGRLLTLLARERDLGGRVMLRSVLRAWTRAETEAVVGRRLAAAGVVGHEVSVPATIHAITAGIPQAIRQLLETVLLVAATQPEHRLCRDDIERMHERLSLAAA